MIISLNMHEFYELYPCYQEWVCNESPSQYSINAVYNRMMHKKSLNVMEAQEVMAFIAWVENNSCKEDLEILKSTIQYMKGVLNAA
ncbi:hypothetical protein [Aeromonas phage AS-zj]|uniref:Uncharacterized protein n=3 Tax=Ceceduovirus TaxID=2842588 RepID=A0A411B860_9CAUD|nr:hypothetical protein HWB28_gp302 [Aeromonas phage AS-zj]YP_009834835.1 hypothetical protein HWB29_gp133 [Aeromonas phage AS-sw]ASU00250.1 hypothetical protein [Aeromonas phage AS-zj]ATI18183.1 hypothetical protein [Aeromonas phage AS-sw]QAX97788.1 hypothetical protein ASswx1_143 [Aeromonas phage Asswx_1]